MLTDNGVEIVLNERKVYEVDWLEDSYKRVFTFCHYSNIRTFHLIDFEVFDFSNPSLNKNLICNSLIVSLNLLKVGKKSS